MKYAWTVWIAMILPTIAQDVAEDIRGPKPLIEIPEAEEPTPWLIYSLCALVGLLLIGAVVWWMKSQKMIGLTVEQKAVRDLRELESKGAALEAGDFALAASGVVRTYIERKFGLAAPKRTTEEFLQELAVGAGSDGGQTLQTSLRSRTDHLRGFLKACDRAKFAGEDLDGSQRGDLVTKARAFVEIPASEETNTKEVA